MILSMSSTRGAIRVVSGSANELGHGSLSGW